MDWSGLEVTGEDILVDGWWTAEVVARLANVEVLNPRRGRDADHLTGFQGGPKASEPERDR
jgi:hypothetical protein